MIATLLCAAAAGAQFVGPGGTIPAVSGSKTGANGTVWRSDVSVLNLGDSDTEIVLVLFPEIRPAGPVFDIKQSDPVPLPAGQQITFRNVVLGTFDERNKNGALTVFATDLTAEIVVASKTSTANPSPIGGTFALSVYGVLAADDTAWIANVEHDGFFRTNVGVFVPAAPEPGQPFIFDIVVYDAEGLEVGSSSMVFEEAGMMQQSLDDFGLADDLLDGWVEITCSEPEVPWYGYATVIDEATGDAVYRPAVTRQSSLQ
jgi:hypothetical protein